MLNYVYIYYGIYQLGQPNKQSWCPPGLQTVYNLRRNLFGWSAKLDLLGSFQRPDWPYAGDDA